MPLSWTEIRDRATTFSRRWRDTQREQAESQSFWTEFLHVFGVDRKRVAQFERKVALKRGKEIAGGRIDLFWPGKLLVEQKSAGRDLNRAFDQAGEYFEALPQQDLPRYILVSDFRSFRLWDLESGVETEFTLSQLPQRIKLFAFVAGYEVQPIRAQDPVNIRAAESMGALHDALAAQGYSGHALEVLMVRLLFCLFADDTGIFQPAGSFREWLESETREDGSDLGRSLSELFDVLNTPEQQRQRTQQEHYNSFPYVNGKLFAETLRPPAFTATTRALLLKACTIDWSTISPAIFGALFQSIMDATARRNLGAHYTSEENILKVLKPLFLDTLWQQFETVRRNRQRLAEFHRSLRELTFFDPACGCGNFLVIAYRELRVLELEILRVIYNDGQQRLDVADMTYVDVDQFHGIEIEEFPAQIAQVALWLTDHQMNRVLSDEFGSYFARIPLRASPNVVCANALQIGWEQVLEPVRCTYLLGNPPFVGAKLMDDGQRSAAHAVMADLGSGGLLDFVSAWYVKAARYMAAAAAAGDVAPECAFVSTNSICQGEQVGVLWGWMMAQGVSINFAHRTFKWSNEASGRAAVHCIIIGFGLRERTHKIIFEYADVAGEPHAVTAANINAYLVDGPDIVLQRRSRPICPVPEIGIGNKPIDGGNYLFTRDEKDAFVAREPQAAPFFRRWFGAEEFLNGQERWCLWLAECQPAQLRRMPAVLERVDAVREMRAASKSAPTRAIANTPTRFHVENFPSGSGFLVVPKVSSERRSYLPIGHLTTEALASDLLFVVNNASSLHFGVLSSSMHNAWIRAVCGRLESRYRYSAAIVYNNFPWPAAVIERHPSAAQSACRRAIEGATQAVLQARAQFPGSTLADLYDPLTMPAPLLRAHQRLDAAVDAAYMLDGGRRSWASEAERVAFLFQRYQALASPAARTAPPPSRRSAAAR